MKKAVLLCLILFAMLIASPSFGAVTGDIALTVEIDDLKQIMSQWMEDITNQLGDETVDKAQEGLSQLEGAPSSISLTGSIIIQGDNLRMELNDPMADLMSAGRLVSAVIMVNDRDGYVYIYFPDTLNGYKVPLSRMTPSDMIESGGVLGNRNYDELLEQGSARAVGTREIFGYMCTGYSVELTGPGGTTIKADMWVADELGFPLAVRTKITGINVTWEIHNLKNTPDRSAKFFRPPGNALIKEVDSANLMSMSGGLPAS